MVISVKYFNFKNVFSIEYIVKFLEYTKINHYIIKLEKGK